MIIYNDNGDILHTILHRVYYRYAFYNTVNEVKSIPGFVAISYLLPPIYQYETNYTKQLVAVYDTS